MPLTSRLTAQVTATQTGTTPTGALLTSATAGAIGAINVSRDISLTDGTGAGAADRLYEAQATIAASGTSDLDLAGVLTDVFGATLTFVRIKGLYIAASAANTNNVVVGAAATNQWATLLNTTGTIQIRPGACALFIAGSADTVGWTVTGGTGDLLRIANGGAGTSVTYDIAIIGASA
jgi:hypothetical protein